MYACMHSNRRSSLAIGGVIWLQEYGGYVYFFKKIFIYSVLICGPGGGAMMSQRKPAGFRRRSS